MKITKDSMVFQFMLKEYEKLYNHFDEQYQAAEKSANFYFVLIGGIVSLNGIILKNTATISLFNLSGIQLLFLLVLCIVGCLIYFKIVEHRLLLIAYVKCLNVNRKWFVDNSEDPTIENYMFYKAGYKSPPFYKKYRHFYWEAIGLSLINSLFSSLLLINLFKRCFSFTTDKSLLYNCIYLALLSIAITIAHIGYYKIRGKYEELKVSKRFENLES